MSDDESLYALDNELVREFNRHAWPEGSVMDALSMALEAGAPKPAPVVEVVRGCAQPDCACTPAERHVKHNYPGEYMGGAE